MTIPLPLLHSVQGGADSAPAHSPVRSNVPAYVLNLSSIEQAQQLTSEQLAGRGFIQYWPVLADLCGGIKPALMLGHAMYWTRGWLKKHPERGGWFWKTAKEWQEATGLTPREQESARSALRELNVWQEELATTPGAGNRLFYRLNIAELCNKLTALAKQKTEGTQGRWDVNFLLSLLGQPVSYYRALADLSGGVIGGLVLSHLLNELRIAVMNKSIDADGFFPFSVEQQRMTLSLGTKSQRNARDTLKKAGFVQEALTKGQRPTLLVSVNLAAILALLTGKGDPGINTPAGRAARKAQDRAQVLGQEGNVTTLRGPVVVIEGATSENSSFVAPPSQQSAHVGAFRQSRAALLSKRQGVSGVEGCPFVDSRAALLSALYTKPTIQNNSSSARERLSKRKVINLDDGRWRSLPLPFDEAISSSAETASIDSSNSELSAAIEADAQAISVSTSKLDEVIWPADIDVESARRVLKNAPSTIDLQELVDELAGQMMAKVVPSPVGYLSTLLRKAKDGTFIPTRAAGVAESRTAQSRYESVLAEAKAAPVNSSLDSDDGEDISKSPSKNSDTKQKLMGIRQSLAQKLSDNLLSLTVGDGDVEPQT